MSIGTLPFDVPEPGLPPPTAPNLTKPPLPLQQTANNVVQKQYSRQTTCMLNMLARRRQKGLNGPWPMISSTRVEEFVCSSSSSSTEYSSLRGESLEFPISPFPADTSPSRVELHCIAK